MKNEDLARGVEVYHRLFTHWGRGVVVEIRDKDIFGYRVAEKYRVRWDGITKGSTEVWCRAKDLRKTFNQKKHDQLEQLRSMR